MKKQNKVAFAHIQALTASLEFKFERVGETTVTGCWAFLPNGFQVGYGESACVDPAEFKKEDGEKYAKERCIVNATNKLWELEGYLLKVTGSTSDNVELNALKIEQAKEAAEFYMNNSGDKGTLKFGYSRVIEILSAQAK